MFHMPLLAMFFLCSFDCAYGPCKDSYEDFKEPFSPNGCSEYDRNNLSNCIAEPVVYDAEGQIYPLYEIESSVANESKKFMYLLKCQDCGIIYLVKCARLHAEANDHKTFIKYGDW